MQVEMSKEQFREMLLAAMFYDWICGGLADAKGEDFEKYEDLEKFLLKIAKDNGFDDLVQKFHDRLVPSDELCEIEERIIDDYDDDVFWHELITRLGKRDFWRTVTPEEEKEIEKQGWLPERVDEFYEKYEEEFEKNGIERLEIRE